MARSKNKLQFVLIARDLSEISRGKILSDFAHVPVVEHYTMKDLKAFFGINRAKVIGFEKSSLARSLYAELKKYRINQPANLFPNRSTNAKISEDKKRMYEPDS